MNHTNQKFCKPVAAFLTATAVPQTSVGQPINIPWSVGLAPENSDYLLFEMDASQFSDVTFSGISLTVAFYRDTAGQSLIVTEQVRAPEVIARQFQPGVVNAAYLAHLHAAALSI